MVFFGVSAGFIVENLRENYVESKRAEQYASSLISDLKEDILNLNHSINRSLETANDIDTLFSMLNQKDVSKLPGEKIYYIAKSLFYQNFIPNKSTMNQLISTGSLQYFKNYSIQKVLLIIIKI